MCAQRVRAAARQARGIPVSPCAPRQTLAFSFVDSRYRVGQRVGIELSVRAGDDADIGACVASCQDTSRAAGLSVIISDFFTEYNWKKAVDYLLYKRRQVLLIQIMTPDEVDPLYDGRISLIDSEAVDMSDPKNMKLRITRSLQKAYAQALADYNLDIKNFCNKRGVDYISAQTDKPIEKVLFGQLLKVGIME